MDILSDVKIVGRLQVNENINVDHRLSSSSIISESFCSTVGEIYSNLIVPSGSYEKGIQFGENGIKLVEMSGYIHVVDKDGHYDNNSVGFYAKKFCVGGPLMIYENKIEHWQGDRHAGVNFVVCGESEMHLQFYDNSTSFDLCQVAKKSTVNMKIPSGCNRFLLDGIFVGGLCDYPLFQGYVNNKTVYLDYEISGSCVIASMSNGFSTDTDLTFRVS